MKPSIGDQCACTGECKIHPAMRCREFHGIDAQWDRGQNCLRQVDGIGLCCDRCARAIERRRPKKTDDEMTLFG